MPDSFPFVLNVVAGATGLSENHARAISSAVKDAVTAGEIDWLAPDRAFDIPFAGEPHHLRTALEPAVPGSWLLDLNIVPSETRRKKLLVADMDSTIIGCECVDELADMAGLKDKVAAITERAMRGEIDFAEALCERVALLKGLPLEALARVYAERVRLNRGARAAVATMRAHGAHTVLVSGGFTYFTARVAEEAGFDTHQGNTLLDDGAALTGEVAKPVLGRGAKSEALEKATAALGLDRTETLAVGDGANDLDMIRRAGLGVAYRAKPVVAAAAGAAIAHSDLTTLLYLQGYRADEIVRR